MCVQLAESLQVCTCTVALTGVRGPGSSSGLVARAPTLEHLCTRDEVPNTADVAPAQTAGSERNAPLENHLLQHSRLRRLGPLDEEQVEVGPLLGRGSFGRVFKGGLSGDLPPSTALSLCAHGAHDLQALLPTVHFVA